MQFLGKDRDYVLNQWGPAPSTATTDGREILSYPQGRIFLSNGVVTNVAVAISAPRKQYTSNTYQQTQRTPTTIPPRLPPNPVQTAPVNSVPSPLGAASTSTAVQYPAPRPNIQPPVPVRVTPPAQNGSAPNDGIGGHLLTLVLVIIVVTAAIAAYRGRSKYNDDARFARARSVTPQPFSQSWKSDTATPPPYTPPPPVPSQPTPPSRAPSQPTPPPLRTHLDAELLDVLDWRLVEELTAQYFRKKGFRAELTGKGSDGGVDVYLYNSGEGRPSAYVQCKAWGSRQIGVEPVRALFGVMAADKIPKGYFVCTGEYSTDAQTFAEANALELISGARLVSLFNQLPETDRTRILSAITKGDYTTPSCPKCESKMVTKDLSGRAQWCCPRYPKCRSKPIAVRKR